MQNTKYITGGSGEQLPGGNTDRLFKHTGLIRKLEAEAWDEPKRVWNATRGVSASTKAAKGRQRKM